MALPESAHVSMEFAFPSKEIPDYLFQEDEDGYSQGWMPVIMSVGEALHGDTDLSDCFGKVGCFSHYEYWIREIASAVALQARDVLGISPQDTKIVAMHMGVLPLEGLRFRFNITITVPGPSQKIEPEAGEQLSLFEGERSKDWLLLPSNLLYQQTRSVISAGREGLFSQREGERWPSHEVNRRSFKAHMVMQPGAGPHDLMLRPEGYEELLHRMQSHIEKMDDLTADVFDIISAKWIQSAPKSPADMITLTADDFLAMRGLLPNPGGEGRRGGYKDSQRQEIASRIASLDQLWINVQEMSATVLENGRRRRRKIRLQTKAVVVTMQAGEAEGEDGVRPFAWRLRPGDGFSEFLLSEAGWETALLALRALEYNPEFQYMEKRLTRYLSVQWRIRRRQSECLAPYHVKTLLEAMNEQPDTRRPQRQRERLEKALDTLARDDIIARWQYDENCNEADLAGRGWMERWLEWGVVIEPNERISAHYQDITRPAARKLPPSAAESQFDPVLAHDVRAVRRKLGMTQAALAELLDINRSALSQFEGLRRPASADMGAKMRAWVSKYV